MKRVRVVRHYKLEPPFDIAGNVKHEDYVKLSKGEIDPGIHPDIAQYADTSLNPGEKEGFDLIITSSLKRSYETGEYIRNNFSPRAQLTVHEAVNECPWDPDNTVDRLNEYLNCVSECCIKDRWNRLKELERFIQDSSHSRVLIISHSFIIRSLYVYFVSGKKESNDVTREDLTSKGAIEPDYLRGFECIMK